MVNIKGLGLLWEIQKMIQCSYIILGFNLREFNYKIDSLDKSMSENRKILLFA